MYSTLCESLHDAQFLPLMHLDHLTPVQLPSGSSVWQEQVSGASPRTFTELTASVHPPMQQPASSSSSQSAGSSNGSNNTTDPPSASAISLMAFSADGSHLASRWDSTPTTVWLWDVGRRRASAVVILHAPVKHLAWHPAVASLLLIHCAGDAGHVHLYDTAAGTPSVAALPVGTQLAPSGGRIDARWLLPARGATSSSSTSSTPALLLAAPRAFVVAHPLGGGGSSSADGASSRPATPADGEGDDSLDSVFQALTGRSSPFKRGGGGETERLVSEVADDETAELEDTFHGRGVAA